MLVLYTGISGLGILILSIVTAYILAFNTSKKSYSIYYLFAILFLLVLLSFLHKMIRGYIVWYYKQ